MTDPQTPAPEQRRSSAQRRPTRPIAVLLLVAAATAAMVFLVVRSGPSGTPDVALGEVVPNIAGTTLDGTPFDLAALRGHPVVINFWGPSCVPCRTEFPLLAAKAAQHGTAGLVIVGVLTDDPVEPARSFVAEHGGTWPTVIDPGGAIKATYHVIARPQSYFVDRGGVLRSIQIGEVRDADFERQYGAIAGGG